VTKEENEGILALVNAVQKLTKIVSEINAKVRTLEESRDCLDAKIKSLDTRIENHKARVREFVGR
jgi:peptidoglycan hydrolase CwlO-like protein